MQESKRVSVKDIAARLHVSLSTVHKALTGKPGISEARRREIVKTAEEMGYVVNSIAQSLSRKTLNIGVILPSLWQEFFAQLKSGIETQLRTLSVYKVSGFYYEIPAAVSAREAESIRIWLSDNGIDAILYCSSHYAIDAVIIQALSDSGCPIFWVGGGTEHTQSVSNITVDAQLTGKLAADFLSCCTGHAKAAVFTGSMKIDIHREKAEAFCQRLHENGGTAEALIETEDDPQIAYSSMDALYREHPDINAIFVATSTSEPVCRYLEEHDLSKRVTLLGTDLFDTLKEYMKKGIMQATINQNQEEVGALAASCAYEYLNKTQSYGNADWKPERRHLVTPTLLLKANIE